MKIISGLYKGRNIEGFDLDGTRPTMERVKESLFAIIQNNIHYLIIFNHIFVPLASQLIKKFNHFTFNHLFSPKFLSVLVS